MGDGVLEWVGAGRFNIPATLSDRRDRGPLIMAASDSQSGRSYRLQDYPEARGGTHSPHNTEK